MEKIYPIKPQEPVAFELTAEEVIILKKGMVIAREMDIEHAQDRALYALKNAEFAPERHSEIHNRLQVLIDMEPGILEESRALKTQAEELYKAGDTVQKLAEGIKSDIVDKEAYARRIIELKTGVTELTPIIKPVIVEPIEEPVEEPKVIELGK